jgi:hypothetical protein
MKGSASTARCDADDAIFVLLPSASLAIVND